MLSTFVVAAVFSHGRIRDGVDIDSYPVNPVLGVSGFPDCVRKNPHLNLNMEDAGMDLVWLRV